MRGQASYRGHNCHDYGRYGNTNPQHCGGQGFAQRRYKQKDDPTEARRSAAATSALSHVEGRGNSLPSPPVVTEATTASRGCEQSTQMNKRECYPRHPLQNSSTVRRSRFDSAHDPQSSKSPPLSTSSKSPLPLQPPVSLPNSCDVAIAFGSVPLHRDTHNTAVHPPPVTVPVPSPQRSPFVSGGASFADILNRKAPASPPSQNEPTRLAESSPSSTGAISASHETKMPETKPDHSIDDSNIRRPSIRSPPSSPKTVCPPTRRRSSKYSPRPKEGTEFQTALWSPQKSKEEERQTAAKEQQKPLGSSEGTQAHSARSTAAASAMRTDNFRGVRTQQKLTPLTPHPVNNDSGNSSHSPAATDGSAHNLSTLRPSSSIQTPPAEHLSSTPDYIRPISTPGKTIPTSISTSPSATKPKILSIGRGASSATSSEIARGSYVTGRAAGRGRGAVKERAHHEAAGTRDAKLPRNTPIMPCKDAPTIAQHKGPVVEIISTSTSFNSVPQFTISAGVSHSVPGRTEASEMPPPTATSLSESSTTRNQPKGYDGPLPQSHRHHDASSSIHQSSSVAPNCLPKLVEDSNAPQVPEHMSQESAVAKVDAHPPTALPEAEGEAVAAADETAAPVAARRRWADLVKTETTTSGTCGEQPTDSASLLTEESTVPTAQWPGLAANNPTGGSGTRRGLVGSSADGGPQRAAAGRQAEWRKGLARELEELNEQSKLTKWDSLVLEASKKGLLDMAKLEMPTHVVEWNTKVCQLDPNRAQVKATPDKTDLFVVGNNSKMYTPVGFMNPNKANLCYVNSVVQCLLPIASLACMCVRFDEPCKARPFWRCIRLLYNNAYRLEAASPGPSLSDAQARVGSPTVVSPELPAAPHSDALKFVGIIVDFWQMAISSSASYGEQQDASEFIQFILSNLHDELKWQMSRNQEIAKYGTSSWTSSAASQSTGGSRRCAASDRQSDGGCFQEVGRKGKAVDTRIDEDHEDSPVKRLFGGLLKNSILRKGSNVMTTLEPFFVLNLPFNRHSNVPSKQTLENAIEAFTTVDDIDNERTTQTFFHSLPLVLFIVVKRFSYSRHTNKICKINTHIEYLEELKLRTQSEKQSNYKLLGVIFHHGEATQVGHYSAAVKTVNSWYMCDDTIVRKCSFDEVQRQAGAYVFLYVDEKAKRNIRPGQAETDVQGS